MLIRRNQRFLRETLMKALPRQGERKKTFVNQHVKR